MVTRSLVSVVTLFLAILFISACSNVKFNDSRTESASQVENVATESANNIDSGTDSTMIEQPSPKPAEMVFYGSITGVAKASDPLNFENFARRGSSIQFHYKIENAVSMVLQIFPEGVDTNSSANLALGEDGKTYGFAQIFNFPLVNNYHTETIRLRTPSGQYLPVGKYVVAVWYCKTNQYSSCKKTELLTEVIP